MEDKDKMKQQITEPDNQSQKPASTDATVTKNETDKKEDDRSDWVVIESGLGIDE